MPVYNKTVIDWLLGQQQFCLTLERICCPQPAASGNRSVLGSNKTAVVPSNPVNNCIILWIMAHCQTLFFYSKLFTIIDVFYILRIIIFLKKFLTYHIIKSYFRERFLCQIPTVLWTMEIHVCSNQLITSFYLIKYTACWFNPIELEHYFSSFFAINEQVNNIKK